jgi:hypothetical protein
LTIDFLGTGGRLPLDMDTISSSGAPTLCIRSLR